MILKTCTACKGTQTDGLTWAVWAWNRADGVRVAYKHKLCNGCTQAKLVPLYNASQVPEMTCPACGIDTRDDMDPVYCAWIPRGLGKLNIEAPMCPACAAHLRIWIQDGGQALEDREPSSRGQDLAPRYSLQETWTALGLDPAILERNK